VARLIQRAPLSLWILHTSGEGKRLVEGIPRLLNSTLTVSHHPLCS
jgi:hypothetical protein